jgi:hypothetical protein
MMTSRRSAFDQAVVADAGGAGIGTADDLGSVRALNRAQGGTLKG